MKWEHIYVISQLWCYRNDKKKINVAWLLIGLFFFGKFSGIGKSQMTIYSNTPIAFKSHQFVGFMECAFFSFSFYSLSFYFFRLATNGVPPSVSKRIILDVECKCSHKLQFHLNFYHFCPVYANNASSTSAGNDCCTISPECSCRFVDRPRRWG